MAWTTPRTWISGEMATAALMNVHVRDNLNFLFSTLDYSAGTWTPTLTFDTPGDLVVAYTTHVGRYNKFGTLVYCQAYVLTSTFTKTTASGGLRVGGIPFPNVNTSDAYGATPIWQGITKASFSAIAAAITASSSSGYFQISGSAQVPATVSAGDMPSGGTVQLGWSYVYFSNQ